MASIERSDRCARNVPRIDGSSTSTPGDVAAADMESDNALGHDMGVPSRLELRSPSGGTGTGEHWSFGGADDRLLRDCLDELAEFVTDAPLEEWDNRVRRHVVVAEDRWRAAMLLWPDEPFERGQQSFNPIRAKAAWTCDGALRLAELLPERLGDLRVAILARFAPSQ